MLADNSLFSNHKGKGKSLGKGIGKTISVGSGKGRGKGQLALEDLPPLEKTAEKLLDEALNKARRMRDLCFNTASNYEEAMLDVKKSKFWSKAAQKDADFALAELKALGESLKKFLMKKVFEIAVVKTRLVGAGKHVKDCLLQIREFRQMAAKAGSVYTGSTKDMSTKGKK